MNQIKEKILFISISEFGGAQKCLLDLIIHLPKRFKPIVIVPNEGLFLEKLKKHEIEYYIVPFRGWWFHKFQIKLIERTFNNIKSIIIIYKFTKKLNIKLVFTNTLYSPIGACLAKILNVPHIWHIHEFLHLNYIQNFDFGLKWSMDFVNRNTNKIICPSTALKENLSNHIFKNKIHIIHNGIDYLQINNKPINNNVYINDEKVFTILIIGVIIEFKGQHDAILALYALRNKGKNVKLIIIGNGNIKYINHLKSIAINLGVDSFISWEGFKLNVNDYLSNANALFVCSKYETFGMVILEAMLNKCPVIATRTGGIVEIIEDGYNGFLYEIGNINNLVEKTELLINDKELYNRISKNSFSTCINQYPLSKYINEMIIIIEETLVEKFPVNN
jgi:glycosyltransferase involved in cell wall biosynthesis